jgi:DNA helicase II / ATP-dependent DNA helicase PcrA
MPLGVCSRPRYDILVQESPYLTSLNREQRAAVTYGVPAADALEPGPPLLILAGAGSGKTHTLAHRVAHLIVRGARPQRILLLTFTRRAAEAMIRRAERICGQALGGMPALADTIEWAGTFHALGARLLRLYARPIGLDAGFTVLDRGDAADLMNLVRDELGLSRKASRFPKKETCLAIYSYAVNAQAPLERVLPKMFPWCDDWQRELKELFRAYLAAKQRQNVLDYDDLLLYWARMMDVAEIASDVARRFDFVLVDEYQDINALQASILLKLRPGGHGLTVVGDDAQAIYGFRAASARNILDFPGLFQPPAEVVKLEQNYRSNQPILEAANGIMGLAAEGFTKTLFSERRSNQRPYLAAVRDEAAQVDYVVERILENREAGTDLREQAVLFRTAHHSALLEVELARRNIPFVKYGGLKFLETAHIKDVLGFLRWAENPRDRVAAFRVLQLLPGIGPGSARRALDHLERERFRFAALADFRPPAAAARHWTQLVGLVDRLAAERNWSGQIEQVRRLYDPLLEERYDVVRGRLADLEQLEQIAAAQPSRERFLVELTLDPPQASGDEAGTPILDEDFLILSTIHSAKGREWKVVQVLNVVDGCIPSDMATGSVEEIEEERRLLYVAMTRAKDELHLIQPLRFYTHGQSRYGDRYVQAPRSRFIADALLGLFDRVAAGLALAGSGPGLAEPSTLPRIDIGASLREMWD